MNIGLIFMKICNMSLTATYCIAAVVLLRFLLRGQPKIFSYLLWSVVLFRLLCPVTVTGAFSLLRVDPAPFSYETQDYGGKAAALWSGAESERGETIMEEEAAAGADRERPPQNDTAEEWTVRKIFTVGGILWLAGVAVAALYSLWSAFRLRRRLSRAVPAGNGVYEAAGFDTPFVFGVLRPRIYLPAGMEDGERQLVLAHERVHITRRDYLWKLLAWGAVCLHWFNPFVWLAYRLAEADMEMSCDEAVLARLGYGVRREYSEALLSLSCAGVNRGGCPIAFGENAVKGRIRHLLHCKKRTAAAVTVMSLLLCAVLLGLAVNPARRDEAAEEEQRQFVTAYAEAFCARDGDALVGLYTDETAAYANIGELEKTEGGYTFGLSSPWPDEYRFVIEEGGNTGAGRTAEGRDSAQADIWYYAWTSDPHIAVWKERLTLQETEEGWRAADSELTWLDSISTAEQFKEAYYWPDWEGYGCADYVRRGFVEAINEQTAQDEAAGGADRNAVYREPQTAVPWILNLTGGESTPEYRSSGGDTVVVYTFADGSQVRIPAYDANFDGATEAFATEENRAYERQENPETDEPDHDADGEADDAVMRNEDFANREVWVVPGFWSGY